ncbi:MAG TPA: hypothetical protein VIO61_10630 [Anaerolineaceae bacterium]
MPRIQVTTPEIRPFTQDELKMILKAAENADFSLINRKHFQARLPEAAVIERSSLF